MDSKLCEWCGAEFSSSTKHPNTRFCSRHCSGTYAGKIPRTPLVRIHTCPQCNLEYQASHEGQKYCSCKCSAVATARRNYPLVAEVLPDGFKRCRKCSELLPADREHFYFQRATTDGFHSYCRECQNGYTRARHVANPDKNREYKQRGNNRVRIEVMSHYCGGTPRCMCCGETPLPFLTIHHIAGGGYAHRQTGVGGGADFCRWLRKNGYPDGYAVLCWNCNMADGMYGCCPHIGVPTSGIRPQRVLALQGYGGLVPSCVCCGITGLEFLAIDHANGDGAYQRREVHPWERLNFYRWLIKHDFPSGFRILCHSCNSARAFYGCCPHEEQHP